MPDKVLNDVFLMIGGEQTKYKANTLKMVYGAGEGITRANQTGGGGAEALHGVDGSTRVGKMMGSFESTYEIKTKLKQLLADRNAGIYTVIQFVGSTGGEPDTLENAQLKNDPEINYASDGDITFEFCGNPMV